MDWMADLTKWYQRSHRDLPWRRAADPYSVWISEIMLQQTRVAAVIPFYERFLSELPTIQDLANIEDDRLMKLWQGLGYYSRARNLKKTAVMIVEKNAGMFPNTFQDLMKLPGIGSYTAAAIASIVFGERVPAVDGNVLRVMARLTDDVRSIADPQTKKAVFSELLPLMPSEPGVFNQAMMELGAVVCTPNGEPRCMECPVRQYCQSLHNGTVFSRPVKSGKAPRTVEQMTVFVLRNGNGYLIRKRPDSGLLAGLYELPNMPGHLSSQDAAGFLTKLKIHPAGPITVYDRTHVFTHREWHMRVYSMPVFSETPEGWDWFDGSQSIPSAFTVCLR